MKLKKVIAIVVVVAVLAGAAVGGVYGYKSYQSKNLVAEVQTVASLNMGYWGDTRQAMVWLPTILPRKCIWRIPVKSSRFLSRRDRR